MTAVGEGVRKVEHVPLLAANVRREELGEQEKAHQSALSAASTAVRYVNTIDAGDETQECFGWVGWSVCLTKEFESSSTLIL
jgi:hypothetical protein